MISAQAATTGVEVRARVITAEQTISAASMLQYYSRGTTGQVRLVQGPRNNKVHVVERKQSDDHTTVIVVSQ